MVASQHRPNYSNGRNSITTKVLTIRSILVNDKRRPLSFYHSYDELTYLDQLADIEAVASRLSLHGYSCTIQTNLDDIILKVREHKQ